MTIDKTYLYQINVTRECNLRCTHCYIHSDTKAASKNMSYDNILKVAKDIKEHMQKINYRHAEIHIVGGEPTMLGVDFYKEVIPLIRDIFKEIDFTYELMLITNLLSKDIVPIASFFDRVTTSYEIKSRFVSLKGTYKPKLEKEWLNNLKLLQDSGIEVGVTTAVTKPVIEKGANQLLDYFYNNGIKQIHFGFFIPEGDGLVNSLDMFPNFKDTSNFLIDSANWYIERREFDENLWVNPFESMLSAVYNDEPLDDIVCPIISGALDINWDGNVATCLEAGGAKSPEWLGNIYNDTIVNVTASKVFMSKVLQASKPQKICQTCEEYSVCKSGCSVLFKFYDPNLDSECPGFKSFIKYVRNCVNSGMVPRYSKYFGKSC